MSGAVIRAIEIGGITYRATFKFGTLRLAEKELGESIASVFGEGGKNVGFDAISAVFWGALQPTHRITREKADDLIDEAGVEAISALLSDGIGSYFGTGEAGADDTDSDDDGDEDGEAGNAKSAKKAKSKS